MKSRTLLVLLAMNLFIATQVAGQAGQPKFYLLEDKLHNIDIVQARLLFQNKAFRFQPKNYFNPGFTRSVYWLAAVIDSTTNPDSLRLLVGNPHINKIDFYAIGKDSAARQYISGDHFPYPDRPIETTRFAFPLSGNCFLYLLRIDKHNESLQLTFEVLSAKKLTKRESEHSIITGILSGIVILLIIFGIYLAIITRKRLYIFYIIYVVSGWLWVLADLGFGYKYLWPDNPWFASRARPVFSALTIILSIQFLAYYVGGIKSKLLKLLLNITTLLVVMLLLLWLAPLNVYDAPALAWVMLKIIPAVTAIYVILGLTALTSEVIARNRMALFYMAALIPLMLLVFVNLLNHSGLINITGTSLESYGVATGYVSEVIILTFGLAYRFNTYRLDKNWLQLQYQVQQKENARALIETEASERKKIADELHDIAGSMLSAAKLNLSAVLESDFISGSETRQKLMKAEEALTLVSTAVRNLSHALSPIMLQRLGFKRSIENIAGFFNTSGKLKVDVVVIGFAEYDPHLENVYAVLYSITYEFLNNIVKHANASGALIQLIEHEDGITLSVEDNGNGFVQDFDKQDTKGLAGITSRIKYLNGAIAFDNTPTGLIISIEIPKEHYENKGGFS